MHSIRCIDVPSFPADDAAMKLSYFALRNISTKHAGEAGTGTQGWTAALNAFAPQSPTDCQSAPKPSSTKERASPFTLKT